MYKTLLIGIAALAGLSSASASLAQAWIGQVVGQLMEPIPAGDWCYDGSRLPKPKHVALVIPYADKAIQKYEELALSSAGLAPIFAKNGSWSLDGARADVHVASDPWVRTGTKLVPESYVRSTYGGTVLVRWKAIAADGRMLGTYDGLMFAKARSFALQELKLYSAENSAQPGPLKPYCQVPGDVEKWPAEKAKREAQRAAKRARSR